GITARLLSSPEPFDGRRLGGAARMGAIVTLGTPHLVSPTGRAGRRLGEHALDFVNRVVTSDDKSVLAEWLRGPYRSHVVTLARSRTRRLGAAAVLPGALTTLLARTRLEVGLGLLRAKDPEDGVAFGYSALAAGHVYRCQDAAGAQGWVPVAQPRMRLADRVLSLVAADYLLRSDDYETALYTCAACGFTEFDAARAALGVCRAHAHSDVRELAPSHVRLVGAG
ncbi:MAG: hypothetical protein ACRELB_09860, partial [Polyangiaceae bacterium]